MKFAAMMLLWLEKSVEVPEGTLHPPDGSGRALHTSHRTETVAKICHARATATVLILARAQVRTDLWSSLRSPSALEFGASLSLPAGTNMSNSQTESKSADGTRYSDSSTMQRGPC